MATLMEKDVLIELVADGLAVIFRAKCNGRTTEELSDKDKDYLYDLKRRLYFSNEKEWDFQKTVDEVNAIVKKYDNRVYNEQ